MSLPIFLKEINEGSFATGTKLHIHIAKGHTITHSFYGFPGLKMYSLSAIVILLVASTINALPTCKLKRRLATRDSNSTDGRDLPFTSVGWTSEHRTSATHPNDWTTGEVNTLLDHTAANLTARQGDADDWDAVPGIGFIYSEPANTKTKFALISPDDLPHPRPLVWKDVHIGIESYRNQTLAEAKSDPSAKHSMKYFAYYVGDQQFLARGFFGDSSEVLPGLKDDGKLPGTS